MTWVAYGEKVNIPDFTIRELVHARQGSVRQATAEAETACQNVLTICRSMLINGGLSFLYTASIFNDMEGKTVGEPLVIRYVPFIDDHPDNQNSVIGKYADKQSVPEAGDDNFDASPTDSPTMLARRTSFGGMVNGQQLLPPSNNSPLPPRPAPPPRPLVLPSFRPQMSSPSVPQPSTLTVPQQ